MPDEIIATQQEDGSWTGSMGTEELNVNQPNEDSCAPESNEPQYIPLEFETPVELLEFFDLNIPANDKSAAYTTVLSDAGKVIHHPSTDANARTFTIDSNANVAYPIGTAITFANMTAQVVTIAITSDTMYLSSAGTTGSRSLAQYGIATAVKLTSTTWLISGSGLT